MYNFEGEYRRTPQQNLAGASRQQKVDELVKRAQEDRRRREELRSKNQTAIKIQAFIRGNLIRKKKFKEWRSEVNTKVEEILTQDLIKNPRIVNDENYLGFLITRVNIIFTPTKDNNSLSLVTKIMLLHYHTVTTSPQFNEIWVWRILSFFKCHLVSLYYARTFAEVVDRQSVLFCATYVSHSRIRHEIGFPAGNAYLLRVFKYVIERSYFSILRQVICLIPESTDLSNLGILSPEWLITEMCVVPFTFLAELGDPCLMQKMIQTYALVMFCNPLPLLVEKCILPMLCAMDNFPLEETIVCLNHQRHLSSPHALYCILVLDRSLKTLSPETLPDYFEVMALHSVGFQSYGNAVDILDTDEDIGTGDDHELEDDDIEQIRQRMREWFSREPMRPICPHTVPIPALSLGVHTPPAFEEPAYLQQTQSAIKVLENCVELLNEKSRIQNLLRILRDNLNKYLILLPMARFIHNLILFRPAALHIFKLLTHLAMDADIQRGLWMSIQSLKRMSTQIDEEPLTPLMSFGLSLSDTDAASIMPLLSIFASIFRFYLATIQDEEFYQLPDPENPYALRAMPFDIEELVDLSQQLRDVALGLLELAYPEPRLEARDQYEQFNLPVETSIYSVKVWMYLFREVVALVKLLYVRDVRRQYTPNNHWVSARVTLPHFPATSNIHEIAGTMLPFNPEGLDIDSRLLTLLKELPFTLSFMQRVNIFQRLLAADRFLSRSETPMFNPNNSPINIRRDYIYEDSFEKLNADSLEEIKGILKIHLISNLGTDEVGVDGGGVFREFLYSLLKTAFDPNRGFFLLTKENQLYPNPNVAILHNDFPAHYFFIGRMLGKAVYEGLLCEIPLAEFFLAKIVGANIDLYLNSLASLDPEVYRNLMYLRTYTGDFSELGLDFTLVIDDFGQNKVVELKPNGSNILVTELNKIEYIHLVADYKMNRQIKQQCAAFQKGIASVIMIDWLSMFSTKELQTLISGTEFPINVDDFKKHTVYTGGFAVDHPTIEMFWTVVRSMTVQEITDLIRFVTSSPRPPLLGFRYLEPPFCIQLVEGGDDRLPTSSTCMNLLKLPLFKDAQTMKEKLLYAIQSGAGFELS